MYRVLLADDDDAVRDMLQAVLERDGFEVVAVANVREHAPQMPKAPVLACPL